MKLYLETRVKASTNVARGHFNVSEYRVGGPVNSVRIVVSESESDVSRR